MRTALCVDRGRPDYVDLCGCGPLHLYADRDTRPTVTGPLRGCAVDRTAMRSLTHAALYVYVDARGCGCRAVDRTAMRSPTHAAWTINADPRGRLVSTRRRTRHRTNHRGHRARPNTRFRDGVARSTWPRRSLVTAFPTDSFAQTHHVFSAVPRRGATLLEFD